MQSCGERLLESYKEIPGPELAAVRMTRELQIEARRCCRGSRTRLMCEQDLRCCVRRGSPECGNRIAALLGIEMMRAVVRHASHDESCALVPHNDVLIQQDA